MKNPNPSSWIYYPTEEKPNGKYKFTSIELNLDPDMQHVSRQTYSLLDWLGDIGGLLDILLHIGAVLVFPVSSFNIQQTLASSFFRLKEASNEEHK